MKNLKKTGVEGVNYFTSEDQVREYVKKNGDDQNTGKQSEEKLQAEENTQSLSRSQVEKEEADNKNNKQNKSAQKVIAKHIADDKSDNDGNSSSDESNDEMLVEDDPKNYSPLSKTPGPDPSPTYSPEEVSDIRAACIGLLEDDYDSMNNIERSAALMRNIAPDVGSPVKKTDDWIIVWDKMKYTGWLHLNPVGLNEGTFLMPDAKLPKDGGVAGEDYLTSFLELKQFAVKYFGWDGDEDTRKAEEEEMGRRGRRRRGEAAATTTTTTSAMATSLTTPAPKQKQNQQQQFQQNPSFTQQQDQNLSTPVLSAISTMSTIRGTPVQSDDDWVNVWEKMKFSGWLHLNPVGLNEATYVLPGARAPKEGGVAGEDYLTSELELKQFAVKHFRWQGDEATRRAEEEQREGGGRRARRGNNEASTSNSNSNFNDKDKDNNNSNNKRKRSESNSSSALAKKAATAVAKTAAAATTTTTVSKTKPEPPSPLTNQNFFTSARSSLLPSFTPSSPSSIRPSESTQIFKFLTESIQNCGAESSSPTASNYYGSLYISGSPGAGKTVTIKNACDKCATWAKENQERIMEGRSNKITMTPSFAFVNVAHLVDASSASASSMSEDAGGSTGSACQQILSKIASAANLPLNSTETQIRNKLNLNHGKTGFKQMVVLILDEIDLLLKIQSSQGEYLLYTLFSWASNPSFLFTFVGVANTIDFRARFLTKLDNPEMGAVPQNCVFPSYNIAQITDIVRNRVGEGVFDNVGLELIARKVSASTGDARKALQLAGKSIDKMLEGAKKEELESLRLDPTQEGAGKQLTVKMKHVMMAVKETGGSRTQAIEALPHTCKIVLCIAMSLCSNESVAAGLSIAQGDLHDYCRGAVDEDLLDDLNSADFCDILSQLQEAGLLEFGGHGTPSQQFDARSNLVTLCVQQIDVECAINKTLSQVPFYKKIMDKVAKQHK